MIIEWNNHMFSADEERFPLHPDWEGKWMKKHMNRSTNSSATGLFFRILSNSH